MQLYTKVGDNGFTYLSNRIQVPKHSNIIECLGHLDELQVNMGKLKLYATNTHYRQTHNYVNTTWISDNNLGKFLELIQVKLYKIMGKLSGYKKPTSPIRKCDIKRLELEIDYLTSNKSLVNFVLPGQSEWDILCHSCRCSTRIAECKLYKLNQEQKVNPNILIYINRLSDYLFSLTFRNIEQT